MKFKKIFLIILLVFSLMLLTGCGNENTVGNLKAKTTEEINYLDNKIIMLASNINNINLENYKIETKEINNSEGQSNQDSQSASESSGSESGGQSGGGQEQSNSSQGESSSDKEKKITVSEMKISSILDNSDKEIDWNNIKGEIELLYSTWDTIMLDLYKLNIPNKDINEFSLALNEATINIKNEDKTKTLESLAKLYMYLPKYLEYCSNTKEEINIKTTKQHIVSAYSMVETENWEEITNEVNFAIDSYVPVMNNLEFVKDKEHAVNRTYIILNELKNSLENKDKDIFYINYKNLINELNLL